MRPLFRQVLIALSASTMLLSQVVVSQSTTQSGNNLSWEKSSDSTYTLFNANGKQIRNAKQLNRLRTDTLSYLDADSRIIYLLPDCVDAEVGSSGKLTVLERNISKDFYVTNPKSFITYIDDESYDGQFVNMDGNYIYYIPDIDKTFLHRDIRKFSNWGASNIEELPISPNNAYWFRNSETKNYWVVVKGEHLDYDTTSAKKNGDDVIVYIDEKPTYKLSGYYTMASYVVNPVEIYRDRTDETSATGCVYGNCNDGWGKWQYDEENYYDGFWSDGLKNGYGLYSWKGVAQYVGDWENDQMNGYGSFLPDNDNDMVGQFRNGELDGLGYKITDGVWRRGIFQDGELSEEFSYLRNGGEQGCTSGDCQNKYGSYWFKNGDNFIGFFKNGKMHQGSYQFANGDRYIGMFNEAEEFHGMGRFFFESGEYYGGQWKNGKFHGRGYYEDASKTPQIGEWTDGVLTKVYKTSN